MSMGKEIMGKALGMALGTILTIIIIVITIILFVNWFSTNVTGKDILNWLLNT